MTPLSILDLIAGITFIFFLLAIINNSLFELLATAAKWRANNLKKWLETILIGKINDQSALESFVNHPALSALSSKNKSTTYIAAKDFASVFIDLVCHEHDETKPETLANIKHAIDKSNIIPAELKRTLLYYLAKTEAAKTADQAIIEIDHFQKQLEGWYDNMMERISGKFKRKAFVVTFIFSTFITIALNIDTISLANYLYSDPGARQQLATATYSKVSDSATLVLVDKIRNDVKIEDPSARMSLDSLKHEMKVQKELIDNTIGTINANIPMGWNEAERRALMENPVKKAGGLIMTILAMCLGAPFWFDVLGKIANLRSSIKPLVKEEEKNT
jgi:hypothetical protein